MNHIAVGKCYSVGHTKLVYLRNETREVFIFFFFFFLFVFLETTWRSTKKGPYSNTDIECQDQVAVWSGPSLPAYTLRRDQVLRRTLTESMNLVENISGQRRSWSYKGPFLLVLIIMFQTSDKTSYKQMCILKWTADKVYMGFAMRKRWIRANADSEGPDQPTYLRSLIRPSLSANRIIGHYRMYQWRENARIRLCACMVRIWICTFCACSKTPFRLLRPIYYLTIKSRVCIICSNLLS